MSLTYQKRVKLALPSNEEDVAEYFQDLREAAEILHWPANVWSMLLQIMIKGKTQ